MDENTKGHIGNIDAVWGAQAIAQEIGVTRRQAFRMLENGLIPGKQIGGRWVALRSELKQALSSAGQQQGTHQ